MGTGKGSGGEQPEPRELHLRVELLRAWPRRTKKWVSEGKVRADSRVQMHPEDERELEGNISSSYPIRDAWVCLLEKEQLDCQGQRNELQSGNCPTREEMIPTE